MKVTKKELDKILDVIFEGKKELCADFENSIIENCEAYISEGAHNIVSENIEDIKKEGRDAIEEYDCDEDYNSTLMHSSMKSNFCHLISLHDIFSKEIIEFFDDYDYEKISEIDNDIESLSELMCVYIENVKDHMECVYWECIENACQEAGLIQQNETIDDLEEE